MGNLTTLKLGNGASLKVGEILLINEHVVVNKEEVEIEPDPYKVDEIWFDHGREPSGAVIIYLKHQTIEDVDRVGVDPRQITKWMKEGQAFIGCEV